MFSLYILSLYNNLTSTLVCTICLVNNNKKKYYTEKDTIHQILEYLHRGKLSQWIQMFVSEVLLCSLVHSTARATAKNRLIQ